MVGLFLLALHTLTSPKGTERHRKDRLMGSLINKKAAVEDIVTDCRHSLTAAEARGGQPQTLAKQHLAGPLAVFDLVEKRLHAAQATLAPLLAQLDARDDEADALLGRVSDDIWNDIARPAYDPTFSLLFPEGGEDGLFTYATVHPDRAFVWALLVLAGANIVATVVPATIASLVLVPARGWRWVTAVAALADPRRHLRHHAPQRTPDRTHRHRRRHRLPRRRHPRHPRQGPGRERDLTGASSSVTRHRSAARHLLQLRWRRAYRLE